MLNLTFRMRWYAAQMFGSKELRHYELAQKSFLAVLDFL